MTDIEELRSSLELLANRGTERSAYAVITAARSSTQTSLDIQQPGPKRILAIAAAAALVAVVALSATVWPGRHDVRVATPDTRETSVTSVTVPGDEQVRQVAIAFGRIWVASLQDGRPYVSSIVRSFDRETGRLLGTVRAPGPTAPDLVGDAYPLVATNRFLWIRTSTGGPAIPEYNGADNVVYRVDPATLEATPERFLTGDGRIAARRDRVAAADYSHLELLREDATVVAALSTDEVVGVEPATIPGHNGLGWMFLDDRGLWIIHEGQQLMIRLDPATGGIVDRQRLFALDAGESPQPNSVVWWARSMPTSDGAVIVGAGLNSSGVSIALQPFPPDRNVVGAVDDRRLLVDHPYALYDTGAFTFEPIPVEADEIADVVHDRAGPLVAHWAAPRDGATTVHLTSVDPTRER